MALRHLIPARLVFYVKAIVLTELTTIARTYQSILNIPAQEFPFFKLPVCTALP